MNLKMTILVLTAGCSMTFANQAFARTEDTRVKILKDEKHDIELDLDLTSVRCSQIGYSQRELKISVNDLAYISFFNHTNPGEIAPCMTAGACRKGFEPKDLIAKTGPHASAKLRRVLKEVFVLDHEEKKCFRELVEDVDTVVGGIPFHHRRNGDLGEVAYQECLNLPTAK